MRGALVGLAILLVALFSIVEDPAVSIDSALHAPNLHFGSSNARAFQHFQSPPLSTDDQALRFVSPAGADSNDGGSWGSAKKTIYEALLSLPGGSRTPPSAGSGTVYFLDGTGANPSPDVGIWLMGPKDPNYKNPPSGWLRSNGAALRIEGLARGNYGPNAHRVRARLLAGANQDTLHPGLWLSGTQSPFEFRNAAIAYPGRPIVIGECSNSVRNGTCGVSGVTLDNVSVSPMSAPSLGPGIDITGGSFWLFLRDVSASGNAFSASSGRMSDSAAAVLIDGKKNPGNGLIQMNDINLAGGGVKFIPGANGGSISIQNLTEEGDYHHDIPPPVWFTDYNGFVDAFLANIQIADPGPTATPAVQNDGSAPGPMVAGVISLVQGPAIVTSQYNNSLRNMSKTPLLERQVGFFNGYVVGETDVARRLGTLVAARFPNRAETDAAKWTATSYGGAVSIQTEQVDPFGGQQAATASTRSDMQESLYLTNSCSAVEFVPQTGDWVVAGAWVRSSAGGYSGSPTEALSLTYCGNPAPSYSYSRIHGGQVKGDGEWQWHWIAARVRSGLKTTMSLAAHFSRHSSISVYGPVLYVIPGGAVSDNEVLEFASSSAPVDSACPVGTTCNMSGRSLVSSTFGTLFNCSSTKSPALCGSSAAGSFVIPSNAASARVRTSVVTATSEILLTQDSSLGARLGVTCNTRDGFTPRVSSRSEASEFSVTTNNASHDAPICVSYLIVN